MSSLKIEPASGSFQIDELFAVDILLDGTDQVNAVKVDLSFSADKLEVVDVDFSGSVFPFQAVNDSNTGTLNMQRTVQPGDGPISGKNLFCRVNFKVMLTGMAEVNIDDTSETLRTGDAVNVLNHRSNGLFLIGKAGIPELDIAIQKLKESFDSLKAVIEA